jgi:hypothetical protein
MHRHRVICLENGLDHSPTFRHIPEFPQSPPKEKNKQGCVRCAVPKHFQREYRSLRTSATRLKLRALAETPSHLFEK